ncbi:ran-binding protein 3a [Triplophysa rosa]|uniref:ran-binding protein 3a n=1 Tax=Triplophysa rosa TaxID=992332 RepID=UPI002545D899|nr:ran-binding protein 3a [Triplophysa rosa]XP_057217992.1 ran-binding protein 3a [Triplophysa rosa]XP_057217993.1 ran-binding protein 3a [Triplophysa rosa]XP_057217994.1 ran-binding protein 3a [Triplophysa rosa]XP_057217995.1 ran-binding protein 3a [Triplophysa rosa]
MADENERPAVAPPVFVFQGDKGQKRSAEESSSDGEDSDKDDGSYSHIAKRERTSPYAQFPPANSGSKNNVFMPSNFCHSPTPNSDSEPEEKTVGFHLKPATLIHGQAPSAGVPSPKPKEAQRSILRPSVLQPPPAKPPPQSDQINSSNGLRMSSDAGCDSTTDSSSDATQDNQLSSIKSSKGFGDKTSDKLEGRYDPIETTFIFGQNMNERAKVCSHSPECYDKDCPPADNSEETNYFLQYITCSTQKADDSRANSAKFVFGQNMSDRVLAMPKISTEPAGGSRETAETAVGLFGQIQQYETQEKGENTKESLEESAARHEAHKPQKCLLERVQVQTGEESESNVLQMQCKLFVFEIVSQSWVERGCGVLRLNDMASADYGTLQSRLVMRTQGSLRVILNTKIWPRMQLEKASEKSIRITAMDTEEQGVKVFLISSSSKDAAQLFAALHHRTLALRNTGGQESDGQPALPESEVIRFSDDDEPRTPPAASTPASGNPEAGVCPVIGDTKC